MLGFSRFRDARPARSMSTLAFIRAAFARAYGVFARTTPNCNFAHAIMHDDGAAR